MKGPYCPECKKDLADGDLKGGACPTCEKKALRVEYCVKTAAGQKAPDRARISYECAGCAEKSEFEADFKHKDDCKKKDVKPCCTKSGTKPHDN